MSKKNTAFMIPSAFAFLLATSIFQGPAATARTNTEASAETSPDKGQETRPETRPEKNSEKNPVKNPEKSPETMTTKVFTVAPTASPGPKKATISKKSTTDELTKKALKRAQIHELEREQQAEVATTNEEAGPIIMRPVVQSEPAPGMKKASAPHENTEQAEQDQAKSIVVGTASGVASEPTENPIAAAPHVLPQTSASTTPEKARQLIMNSHVFVNGDPRPESAPKTGAETGAALKAEAVDAPIATTAAPSSTGIAKEAQTQVATVAVIAASSAVSAEQSLKWLTNGNSRFTKKHFRADGRSEKDRARIWNGGQKPHAVVLACSDSVLPPEVVFDQTLGEIYVVRTLGEVTDSAALASLEYAVQYLGPHMLVVMGHTRCDAVQGIIQLKETESAGSEALDHLLSEIRVHTKSYTSEKPSPNLEIESTLNADGVARDLVKRSEIIRKRVEAGQLVIKSALYRGDTGKVNFY